MTTAGMIALLERGQRVPGTVIARSLLPKGIGWSVSVGELQQMKEIRYGYTIRAALMKFPRVRRALARAARR